MARKPKTLDDLLPKEKLTAWCKLHGLNPKTLYSARRGLTKPTRGFQVQLAMALGVSVERVAAAVEASRR